jgi:pimeloyl-ACP methyl ester carboxylesterase
VRSRAVLVSVVLGLASSGATSCCGLSHDEARARLMELASGKTMLIHGEPRIKVTLEHGSRSVPVWFHHIRAGNPEAKTKLLLIHGYPDSLLTWAEIMPSLEHYDVRALDLPGQGLTAGPLLTQQELSPEVQADAIWSFLQELGWSTFPRDPGEDQDRLVLVGHSFGGLVASLLAGKHADNVAQLVLIDPEGVPRKDDEHLPGEQKLRAGWLGFLSASYGLARWFEGDDWERETRRQYLELSNEVIVPCWERVLEYSTLLKVRGNYVTNRLLVRQERTEEAKLVQAGEHMRGRTRLIWGCHDRLFPPRAEGGRGHATIFEEWFGTTAVMIEDSGHLPQRENTQATAEAITAFID